MGFYCKIITTEIASHFISNSTGETQPRHFTRTQGSTFGKEEVQDRAHTSIYLIETLCDALPGALATEDVCPLPACIPSHWLLHQLNLPLTGSSEASEVAEAPANSPRSRLSVCQEQRESSLVTEHSACPPASTWGSTRGWLGPTPCRKVVTFY